MGYSGCPSGHICSVCCQAASFIICPTFPSGHISIGVLLLWGSVELNSSAVFPTTLLGSGIFSPLLSADDEDSRIRTRGSIRESRVMPYVRKTANRRTFQQIVATQFPLSGFEPLGNRANDASGILRSCAMADECSTPHDRCEPCTLPTDQSLDAGRSNPPELFQIVL